MFAGFLLLTVFMIVTGFALYSEGAGAGSWQYKLFGWVIPLFGQSQDVHTWHRLGMWAMICFVMFHVYAAIAIERAVAELTRWGAAPTPRPAPLSGDERVTPDSLALAHYEQQRPSPEAACRLGDERFFPSSVLVTAAVDAAQTAAHAGAEA
jgi:hypothetical protein